MPYAEASGNCSGSQKSREPLETTSCDSLWRPRVSCLNYIVPQHSGLFMAKAD